MASNAATAMQVAIDAGASLEEMQRVLLKSVDPQDLFMAIRKAAVKERARSQQQKPDQEQKTHLPQGIGSSGNSSIAVGQSADTLIPTAAREETTNKLELKNKHPNGFNGYEVQAGSTDALKQLAEALALPGSNAAKNRQVQDASGIRDTSASISTKHSIQSGWVGRAPPPDHIVNLMTPAKSQLLKNELPPSSAKVLSRSRSTSVDQLSKFEGASCNMKPAGKDEDMQTHSRPSSRPSSATTAENAQLMSRLEAQAQKKAQLGTLVSQFASLLQQNDPIDTMKERLREMDKLQEAYAALELELDQANARMTEVEDGAARQVRSVLDTNGKLQQELVQLSRDLTQAEQALASEKKRCGKLEEEANSKVEEIGQRASEESKRAQELHAELLRSKQDMESLIASKKAVVSRLQALTDRASKLQSENDSLTEQKSNISKHVWNLTDKLKTLSAENELVKAKETAAAAEIQELISAHRQELNKLTHKKANTQSKLEAAEKAQMVAETNFQARLRTLQDAQEDSSKARQKAEERAQSLSNELTEAHNLTMSLRREVARLTANGGSIQRELDQEREELVGLRARASELEQMALAFRTKCEELEEKASAAEESMKKSREEAKCLREDLRGEQKAREQISQALKQARDDLNQAQAIRVAELAKLEAAAAREAESFTAELKARDAADVARQKEMEEKAKEKATEWAAEYETDVRELREVLERKERTIVSLEERAMAAEQGLVEKTNEISTARMNVQKWQDANSAAEVNAKKFEKMLAQGEKAMNQMRARLQTLENSKAELLSELRDRNDECIRLSAENKSEAEEHKKQKDKLVTTVDKLTIEVQKSAENNRKTSNKVEELLQRATTAEESAKKLNSVLEETQNQLRKKSQSVKAQVEEVSRFSSSVSSLRERNAELECELQQESNRLMQTRKAHNLEIEKLRKSMGKERADLEKNLSQRIKNLEKQRANDLEEMKRGRVQAIEEAAEKLSSAVNTAKLDAERLAEKKMQDERAALRNELEVIQTRYNEKVATLEECIRGLTGEANMHVKRGQELVEDLERERNNVRQLREREHINSIEAASLRGDIQKLKKELRSAEERHYIEHVEAMERLTSDLESQRQRHTETKKEFEKEEARSQDLKRKLEDMEEEKNNLNIRLSDLERQLAKEKSGAQQKQKRNVEDMERLDQKLTSVRHEKNEALKAGEKMRLRLRASEREKAELEHQLHVANSELEWSSRELEKSRAYNKSNIDRSNGIIGTEDDDQKPGRMPPYAVSTIPTAGEMEQLRRQNHDLRANVKDLTHAMKTLTGAEKHDANHESRRSRGSSRSSSRGSSRGSNRTNSRGSSRVNSRGSSRGIPTTLGQLDSSRTSENLEASLFPGSTGAAETSTFANEDPRREKVRLALAKRRAIASEKEKKLKPETSPHQQNVKEGSAPNRSPDEYDRDPRPSQKEQWKARQAAARRAGGAQFVSPQVHYGVGSKSEILKRKHQLRLKSEHEMTSPMGTTSKSSVAMARRLARDDVH